MFERIKKNLGFPYSKELEREYKEYHAKMLYKPLLVVVFAVLVFLGVLILFYFFTPDLMAPPEYLPTFVLIHTVFFFFTLIIFFLSIVLRKQLMAYPTWYFVLVTTYAVGTCIWGSTLAAYADYPNVLFTAYGYITFILALVLVLKPWQAIVLFGCNYVYYTCLILFVFPNDGRVVEILSNAAMATILGIVIAGVVSVLRTRSFYYRIKAEEHIEHISEINVQLLESVHFDGLTGLYNRRFYDEVLPSKLEELKRSQNHVCGMMFDIDNFKDFNDRYGHQAGDVCLKQVATTVNEVLSSKDTYLVRYGGEEFYVLAAIPNKESAIKLAERIRMAVEGAQIEHLATERAIVTISVGIALLEDGDDLDTLTKYADEAVYKAKNQGRNQVAYCW